MLANLVSKGKANGMESLPHVQWEGNASTKNSAGKDRSINFGILNHRIENIHEGNYEINAVPKKDEKEIFCFLNQ